MQVFMQGICVRYGHIAFGLMGENAMWKKKLKGLDFLIELR